MKAGGSALVLDSERGAVRRRVTTVVLLVTVLALVLLAAAALGFLEAGRSPLMR